MKKHIKLFEEFVNECINKFDINEKTKKGDKYWFNDKEEWNIERNKINVSDDDENSSRDDKGELISFWDEDRDEGWIKI